MDSLLGANGELDRSIAIDVSERGERRTEGALARTGPPVIHVRARPAIALEEEETQIALVPGAEREVADPVAIQVAERRELEPARRHLAFLQQPRRASGLPLG